jgi:hypothetical protein
LYCFRALRRSDLRIFWDVMPRSPLKVKELYGGICRLHIQCRKIIRASNEPETRRYAYAYGIRGGFPHALRPLCGLLYVPYRISNQPPYPISTVPMLAPPTREQWYLLASPFLSKAAGTKPPPPSAMFGREMADNFAQRPPWGLRFFNVQ